MACGRPLPATLGPAAGCVPAGHIGKRPRRKGGCRHRTSTRLPSPAMTWAFPEGMVGEGRACRCGPWTIARWSHPGWRVTTRAGLTHRPAGRTAQARRAPRIWAVRSSGWMRAHTLTQPTPAQVAGRVAVAQLHRLRGTGRGARRHRGAAEASLYLRGWCGLRPEPWAPRPGRPVSLAPRQVAGAGRWPIRGPRPAPPPSPEAVPGPGTPGPRPRRNPRGGSRPVAWPARPGWGRPASFLPPRAAPRPGPARRRRSPVPTKARRETGSC